MSDILVTIQKLNTRQEAQKAFSCMTGVPNPWPDALCRCQDWVADNLGNHVEGFHLRLDDETVIGHLYYALSERALFPYEVESNVGVLYCEWVQPQYQQRGFGNRLFNTFADNLRSKNAKGILVEATDMEGQRHQKHYLDRGFNLIHESDSRKLLYLPLLQPEVAFRPLEPSIQPRRGLPVEIVILNGYMCPHEISTQIILRQMLKEFGDRVNYQEISLTSETLKNYGVARGIFINGRQKLLGGEPEEAIRQAILEEF